METKQRAPLITPSINPLERTPIHDILDVGVRAINSLLTVGRGQRMGLFAGSGVGKSVLLGMMARFTQADIIVVGLIGERGREVKDFIENILGADGLRRAVVVAALRMSLHYCVCKGHLMPLALPNIFATKAKAFYSSWIH